MRNRRVLPFFVRGLSLVELMVAIAIGLLIMAAVSAVFVNSRANYTTQESLARLQENARVAINVVARDLRMTGYYGCADAKAALTSVLQSSASVAYNYSVPIEGLAGESGKLYPSGTNTAALFPAGATPVTSKDPARCPSFIGSRCTGTDAIAIRMSDPASRVLLTATMPSTSAPINVSSSLSSLNNGDVIVVSDCGAADLVHITNVTNASGSQTIAHSTGGTPANAGVTLSRIYASPTAQVTRFVNRVYYIGTGASGYPALFRQNIDPATAIASREEIVDGISDMQIVYGVVLASDRTPRVYATADDATNLGPSTANWANVVSARLQFTSISVNTTTPSAAVNASSPNQVQPKQFFSTVLLRNVQ
jgi:type IV pilus assembly protein PilW